MRNPKAGFSLLELLIALLVSSLLIAGVLVTFLTESRAYAREEIHTTLEQNLRAGAHVLEESIRNAGFGVPRSNLSSWIGWVSGFTENPRVVFGTGTEPDTITVAGVFEGPVAWLQTGASPGDGTLTLDRNVTSLLNASPSNSSTGNRSLILIGYDVHALVRSVTGDRISIDTSLASNNQALDKGFPVGTPIHRVDVRTFTVASGRLTMNPHWGTGAQPLAEGIENLQIIPQSGTRTRYEVALTSRSPAADPLTSAARLVRTARFGVTLRNG